MVQRKLPFHRPFTNDFSAEEKRSPGFWIRAENGRFPVYAKAMIKAEAEDTVLTEEFRTGGPDTPHRVIRSSLGAAKTFQGDVVGERYLRSANGWSPVHKLQPIAVKSYERNFWANTRGFVTGRRNGLVIS